MEKHKCKLCLKTFTNGRALGGHMRSHMLNLYLNSKPPSPSSSSSETETELSKNVTVRRRSKRIRKPETSWFNNLMSSTPEPMSSVSNASPEEDVAFCLMMLSRDKWTESDQDITDVKRSRNSTRMKYRCDTCNKSFRSYQALGGHKASHKKVKVNHNIKNQETTNVLMEDKVHECPVCFKVFGSGQALGGHKRTHVMNVDKKKIKFIDLNLPAPIDDEDEVSVVSDGEFVK